MSIFPVETISTIIEATTSDSTDLPLLITYAWDFVNDDFLLTDGKNTLVTGIDAVKVWAWKALHTPRYRYLAYSWNYGNEFEDLINKGYSNEVLKSEIERCLKEALLISAYITSIQDISIVIDGSKVSVDFTIVTIYGEASISV
ncbi:DUF2634 domain-containing protein [Clostridium estertheticum]|uniref:DUF2634 domain-containing protein n=1 Tax=Clostridium estertheticum TaxID=238834 RepID=UPI00124EBDDD|nr:DUF2634 domain-containing protein [Clostridium estertheticum]MBZ9615286.1 DUF2634 domain-containing protein [Clostridium estertheticum subsp. laramiense]WAG75175.1 DUF2634 domain-containing protein [Clostridium estertheticum]